MQSVEYKSSREEYGNKNDRESIPPHLLTTATTEWAHLSMYTYTYGNKDQNYSRHMEIRIKTTADHKE